MENSDPNNCWKYGIFYFNKYDDRIIVPKRFASLGWTLNFAHKKAIFGSLLIIILIILTTLFLS